MYMATYSLRDKVSLENCFPGWSTLSPADLKKAYKKKALEYHPDKNPNGEAMFKQVSKWYNILIDSKERRVLEADLSAFNRADIHRTSTFDTAAFPTQHSTDTRQTYHSQSRKTAQQAQAEKEFDEKLRREEFEAKRTGSRPLAELLAEQQMEISYTAITKLVYEIEKQLTTSGEDLSQVTATRLLNQIAQVRVKIAAMLSDNYIYKNILIKEGHKKKSLENELPLKLTTLENDVQNKLNRSKPRNFQTTAPKVRRMHHPSSESSFQNMAAKPGDKSDVAYTTHLENLANDLLSTPKKQYDTNKRRRLDVHRPEKLGEIERELYATDLAYKQDLLRTQQEEAQKVTLADLGSRHPTSSHQPSNLDDLLEELLNVYTKNATEQQRNPEQVTRLTERAIEELRNMRNNNPAAQASWRRKR